MSSAGSGAARRLGALLQPVLALGLFGVALAEMATGHGWHGPLVAQIGCAALITLPLLIDRRHAAIGAGLPLVAMAGTCLAFGTATSSAAFFAVLAASFLAGLRVERRRIAFLGLAALACAAAALRAPAGDAPGGYAVTFTFAAVTFGGGAVLRGRARVAESESARAERVEQEAELTARVALQDERARIARELHDVVAHAVSVIVVQSVAGATVLDADPAAAMSAFDVIETTGQQALGELRRLLGVLREVDESMLLAPQPTLGALDDLLHAARAAGLRPEVRVQGPPRSLPAAVDLSAYRILQEALTNALKHAGALPVLVDVRYDPDALRLQVSNPPGPGTDVASGGHGLLGMRERVALCGGTLSAGPSGDGGFTVAAELPVG